MSQRLIKPGLGVVFRGKTLRPFVLPSGRMVWPVAGGAEDDSESDPEDKTEEEEGDGDSSEEETEEGDDTKDKKDDEEETIPKWKYDKLHARMEAADRRSSALQRQLDELKDKKDISDDVRTEIADLKPKVECLQQENSDLRIKVAFFGVNTVDWHDPDTALRMLDLSEVDVDEKGNVDKRALKSAIRDLAKSKPYLVKPKQQQEDGEEPEGGKPTKMAGQRKGQGNRPSKEQLASRFAVLNHL